MTLPNFLHLGPGKSGSTWVHETLSNHPQVYVTGAKDLYFFSRYYDRGLPWYEEQFRAAAGQPFVGEVCPDYLAAPWSADRIHASLGDDVRFMVSLRDPVDRAFSSYLYAAKHGLAAPTFRESAVRSPEFVEEGRYGSQLRSFLAHYPREHIHVSVFDDLEADPQAYLDGITDFLGVDRQPLTPEELSATLPASKARFLPLAKAAQRGAGWLRSHDGATLVGRVKRSALVQKVLYQPLGDARPVISDEDAGWVKDQLRDELALVRDEFGIDVASRWGW